MKQHVEDEDGIILFWEKTRDYLVPVHDGGNSGILMRFCPWCGTLIAGDEAKRVYRAKNDVKKRDVLDELAKGMISPEQAEQIYEDLKGSPDLDFATGLGLSKIEMTAFGQGVGLPELARWREKGWPDRCVACGAAIQIPKFGWMAKEIRPEHHVLEHVTCPARSRSR